MSNSEVSLQLEAVRRQMTATQLQLSSFGQTFQPDRVCSPTSVLPKSVWDSTLSKNRTCLPDSCLYPLYFMMDWGLSYLVGRGGNEVWGRRRGSLTGSDWSVGDSDLYESYRGLEAHKKHVWFIKMWLRGVIIYKSLAVIITRVLTDDQRE